MQKKIHIWGSPLRIICFCVAAISVGNQEKGTARKFEFTGFIALALAVGAAQLVLDRGQRLDWFESPEIIQGTFDGVFKMKQIPLMLENALGNLYAQSSSNLISPGQSLKFNFKVYNKIIEVFYPELEFGANTFFKGVLDCKDSLAK